MPVGSTRSFKASVRRTETRVKQAFTGGNKRLIRPPSASREALLMHKLQAVLRRAKILLISENQIGLHRRTKRIHVAICVFTRKDVLTIGERPEVVLLNKAH